MSGPLPVWEIPEVPPKGGFTAEEFLEMSELPPHSELIDGNLVFVSPQEQWHGRIMRLIAGGLVEQAPLDYEVVTEMTVRLGKRQVPEPDVLVITADAYERAEDSGPSTYYFPEDVLLAVEIESPESLERDRFVKPVLYAKAGIPNYWRVQHVGSAAVVHIYRLGTEDGTYHLTERHEGVLKADRPFPATVGLATRSRRRESGS